MGSVINWEMQMTARFLDNMNKIPDSLDPGGKTLLDNPTVLIGTELSQPEGHGRQGMTFFMAGTPGRIVSRILGSFGSGVTPISPSHASPWQHVALRWRGSALTCCRALTALTALSALLSCEAQIIGSSSGAGAVGRASDPASDPAASGAGTARPIGADGLPDYRTSPGVRLLTRREYSHSIESLLGVKVDANLVPLEQQVAGHGQIAAAQGVGLDDVDAYYSLGLQVAQTVVARDGAGCSFDDRACAAKYVDDLLVRAFREPLSAEGRARYLTILDAPAAGSATRARLVTLVAAALSSPDFLYRKEIGSGSPTAGGVGKLSDYEIATRLSYLLGETGPDQPLLDAAASGALQSPAGRLAQLDRLITGSDARLGMRGFVFDWLGLSEGKIENKDPEVLKATPPNYAADALESLGLLVDDVLFDKERDFLRLLDVDRFVANQSMAGFLGIDGATSSDFGPLALKTAERRGVLTHPAVLAAHTKESGASPFPIGKFIYERMLCEVIGKPVQIPSVDVTPVQGETLRQKLEGMTAGPSCSTCHTRIGPPGFAFLAYDPVGRYQANDGLGRPYDTAGVVPVGGDNVAFQNAPDLVMKLAGHPNTARCVARRMFRWTFGRFEGEPDKAFMDGFQTSTVTQGAAVTEVLKALVGSETFAQVRAGAP